ncbi:TIGR03826 family flagellar region protein [Neobacillus drentensis]|uniref:TIGR03826 family flagellar region protein n=1 Tax=Neobacillus drentensis TaxID=220684 RepID=UPI003002462E
MNVENCPRCDRIFAKGVRDICPKCYQEIENEYEICVKYLREYKQATMQELSEETGVSVSQITKFLREGRISMKNSPNMSYPCDACGQPIREGNLCVPCRGRLVKDINQLNEDTRRKESHNQPQSGQHAYRVVDRFRDME